jgi:hypothetical protein
MTADLPLDAGKVGRDRQFAFWPIAVVPVAARWPDGLIYLKTVSETWAEPAAGRQR